MLPRIARYKRVIYLKFLQLRVCQMYPLILTEISRTRSSVRFSNQISRTNIHTPREMKDENDLFVTDVRTGKVNSSVEMEVAAQCTSLTFITVKER